MVFKGVYRALYFQIIKYLKVQHYDLIFWKPILMILAQTTPIFYIFKYLIFIIFFGRQSQKISISLKENMYPNKGNFLLCCFSGLNGTPSGSSGNFVLVNSVMTWTEANVCIVTWYVLPLNFRSIFINSHWSHICVFKSNFLIK